MKNKQNPSHLISVQAITDFAKLYNITEFDTSEILGVKHENRIEFEVIPDDDFGQLRAFLQKTPLDSRHPFRKEILAKIFKAIELKIKSEITPDESIEIYKYVNSYFGGYDAAENNRLRKLLLSAILKSTKKTSAHMFFVFQNTPKEEPQEEFFFLAWLLLTVSLDEIETVEKCLESTTAMKPLTKEEKERVILRINEKYEDITLESLAGVNEDGLKQLLTKSIVKRNKGLYQKICLALLEKITIMSTILTTFNVLIVGEELAEKIISKVTSYDVNMNFYKSDASIKPSGALCDFISSKADQFGKESLFRIIDLFENNEGKLYGFLWLVAGNSSFKNQQDLKLKIAWRLLKLTKSNVEKEKLLLKELNSYPDVKEIIVKALFKKWSHTRTEELNLKVA